MKKEVFRLFRGIYVLLCSTLKVANQMSMRESERESRGEEL